MSNYKLGDIASIQAGPFGTQLHKNEYVLSGIPMLNSKNIGNGQIITESVDHVPQSVLEKLPQYILKEGDILFGRAGTIERHAYVTSKYNGSFQGTNCIRIRCHNKNYALYIYYYLCINQLKQTIENKAGGSIQAYITTDLLKKITVYIHKNYEKIAYILSIIDAKIENNNKINDNLQHQLKLMYDYWFTQFDFPDENGKPYRSSGGAMLWNVLLKRDIPIGWQVTSITDNALLQIIKPGISEFKGNKTYLATADIVKTTISKGNSIDYKTRESRANMQPTAYSVWFAKMKNSIKHLNFSGNIQEMIDTTILSTGFCGLQCFEHSFEYIASFIEHSYFEMVKDTLAHGATQEAVNNDDLCNIALLNPPTNVLHLYHERTKDVYAKICANICENKKLSAIHDWLLPMLMNGQVSFKEESEQKPQIKVSGFEQWVANQGFAARGEVDMDVLQNIYEAMDEDDK